MVELSDLQTAGAPSWCPGCGNYSIWQAIKMAIVELNIKTKDIVIVSGVGCSGKYPYWIKTYGFHSIHGRTLPVATGIRLANQDLKVMAIGGDGDGYSEGTNHLLHAARRNIDIAYLVCNNQIYGLTTGQVSPTSLRGTKTKTSPSGSIEWSINPISIALAAGTSFVARGFAGDVRHLTDLIIKAITHEGFGFLDILQPCVTFNKVNTYKFFRERIYKLQDENHDPGDVIKAYEKSLEWGKRIPIGIFYDEKKPTYESQIRQLTKSPLSKQNISDIDISSSMKKFV